MDPVKIILIGNAESGKTRLIKLVTGQAPDEDYRATHEVAPSKLTLLKDRQEVPATLWDTPGNPALVPLLPTYLVGADAILFVMNLDQPRPDNLMLFKEIITKSQTKESKNYAKFIIVNETNNNSQLDLNNLPQIAEKLGWVNTNECKFLKTSMLTGELHELTYKSKVFIEHVRQGKIKESLPIILYNQLQTKNLLIDTPALRIVQEEKEKLMADRIKQTKHRKSAFAGGVAGATIGAVAGLCFVGYGIYSVLLLPLHPVGIGLIVFGAVVTLVCVTVLFFLARKEKIAQHNDLMWANNSELQQPIQNADELTKVTDAKNSETNETTSNPDLASDLLSTFLQQPGKQSPH